MRNLAYVEQLYASYSLDPQSVPADWQDYFRTTGNEVANGKARLGPSFRPRSVFNPATSAVPEREEFQLGPRAASVSDQWRARVILSLMYAFFRFATGRPASRLTPADDFLQGAMSACARASNSENANGLAR